MKTIFNEIKKQMSNDLDFSNAEDLEMLDAEDLEMLEMAEDLDDLDAEDFETMDNADYAEYLEFLDSLEDAEKRKGLRRGKKGHRVRFGKKKVKRHQTTLKGRAKLAALGGGGSYAAPGGTSKKAPIFASASYIQDMMTKSKGDLNITVTRETANIVGVNLPYILFDLNGLTSGFISTLKNYLPAGVTVAQSVDALTGDLLLTYTAAGPLVDIVRISLTGSQISYSEFLQNMNTNFFKTRYIRQEYPNDANLLSAVSQTINFGLLSALGMNNKNNLLPRSRRLSSDYHSFIINLFLPEQKVTSDFSFVQNIIPVAGAIVAWDVFMSERTNLNNM